MYEEILLGSEKSLAGFEVRKSRGKTEKLDFLKLFKFVEFLL